MSKAGNSGFTLIELMIVIAIVGILAAVAVPAYSDYVKRGKITDAVAELSSAKVQAEQFYQDSPTHTYVGFNCPAETNYFTFACDTTATTFSITASGKNDLSGFVYTINESNTKTSDTPWGDSTTCWVNKKGGLCT